MISGCAHSDNKHLNNWQHSHIYLYLICNLWSLSNWQISVYDLKCHQHFKHKVAIWYSIINLNFLLRLYIRVQCGQLGLEKLLFIKNTETLLFKIFLWLVMWNRWGRVYVKRLSIIYFAVCSIMLYCKLKWSHSILFNNVL